MGKPNFSELGRKLGIDRRTVKKYYEGNVQKGTKTKKSKIDDYYDIIKSLLSAENKQIFYYKSHLYRYLVREHGLECSRSNFNYFILKNNEFTEYFKPKSKKDAIKSETLFGKFVDNMLASAILERLIHHSSIVNILGNSYRTASALSKISNKVN